MYICAPNPHGESPNGARCIEDVATAAVCICREYSGFGSAVLYMREYLRPRASARDRKLICLIDRLLLDRRYAGEKRVARGVE